MKTILTAQSIINESIDLLFADKKRTGVFFILILLCEVLSKVVSEYSKTTDSMMSLNALLGTIIYVFIALALQATYTYLLRHTTTPLRKSFFAIQPFLTKIFVATLVIILVSTLGFIAFLVPGLIVFTMWFIAVPLIMFEGKGVRASLSESRARTKGNRLPIFLALLVYIIVSIVVATVASKYDTSLLVAALSTCAAVMADLYFNTAVYVVYKHLSSHEEIA